MGADRGGFRPDIEGLRGVAILLVVAFHAGVPWVAGGFVGVDVFFVLSGFLISGLLTREVETTGDVDISEFYARRAQRLLPVMLVVLVATIASTLWLYAPIDQLRVVENGPAVALHYGNVFFAQTGVNYHNTSSNPFLHTWSLAVEEQFYLVWPLLFALIARAYTGKDAMNKRLLVAIGIAGVASFIASVVLTQSSQPWAFYGMPTRVWEFALGAAAAWAIANPGENRIPGAALQALGVAAIGVAVFTYHEATAYPGVAALLPALGTVALLIGGHRAPESAMSRGLSAGPLRWFGRVSYSWYLWHWPLVGLGAVIDWDIGVGGRIAWSLVALVLAVITLKYIEEPARRSSRFAGRPQVLTLTALGASAFVALLAYGATFVARDRARQPEQRRFAAARVDGMEHECWGSMLENATAPCVFGDLQSSTRVVLMGDSHAEHWLPAMDRIGRERHWKVYAMVKPGCPVADMPELMNARLKRTYSECTEWRRSMLRRIVGMRPNAVVLSSWDHYMPGEGGKSAWQVTPEAWRAGLRRTYSRLSAAGLRTVVIRGTPRTNFDVPACLSRQASGAPFQVRACEYERARGSQPQAVAAQNQAARGLAGIAFVDMNDRVCATARCPVVQRGAIVFRDDNHLTATFSLAEAPVLGARIVGALRGR